MKASGGMVFACWRRAKAYGWSRCGRSCGLRGSHITEGLVNHEEILDFLLNLVERYWKILARGVTSLYYKPTLRTHVFIQS